MKKYFILLIVLFLLILYYSVQLFFSLDTIDSGFVLSLVGRLKSGQLIYKDFDHIRPFGTPLVWDLICKPISFQNPYLFIIVRCLVIIQTLIISWFVVNLSEIKLENSKKLFIIALTNILFLHNFNIMPWHTIDGIFFGVISIFLTKNRYYFLAVVFALFSATTKQSFFVFFVLSGIVNLILIFDNLKKIKLYDVVLSIFFVSIFLYLIYQLKIHDSFNFFINQIRTNNGPNDFIEKAIISYFPNNFKQIIIYLISILFLLFLNKRNKKSFVFLVFFISTSFVYVSPLINDGTSMGDKLLFLCLSIQSFFFVDNRNKKILLFLLLLLGWSSSISWGYDTPKFLLFPIFLILFDKEFKKLYFEILIIVFVIVFIIMKIVFPYCSDSPIKTKYIKAEGVNAISGIFMPEKHFEYFKESNRLFNQHRNNVIFLPDNPIADIINNDFPGRASWEMDIEYPNWKNDIFTNKIIVVDKNPIIPIADNFFKSSITQYFLKNKTKIDSTFYFNLYK